PTPPPPISAPFPYTRASDLASRRIPPRPASRIPRGTLLPQAFAPFIRTPIGLFAPGLHVRQIDADLRPLGQPDARFRRLADHRFPLAGLHDAEIGPEVPQDVADGHAGEIGHFHVGHVAEFRTDALFQLLPARFHFQVAQRLVENVAHDR